MEAQGRAPQDPLGRPEPGSRHRLPAFCQARCTQSSARGRFHRTVVLESGFQPGGLWDALCCHDKLRYKIISLFVKCC